MKFFSKRKSKNVLYLPIESQIVTVLAVNHSTNKIRNSNLESIKNIILCLNNQWFRKKHDFVRVVHWKFEKFYAKLFWLLSISTSLRFPKNRKGFESNCSLYYYNMGTPNLKYLTITIISWFLSIYFSSFSSVRGFCKGCIYYTSEPQNMCLLLCMHKQN